MRINKEKSIGRVLFIVEGGKTEFVLLRRIFCDVLAYEYIEKRREKATYFQSRNISTSKVAVINTEESNISFIKDKNQYLENIFSTLIPSLPCKSTLSLSKQESLKNKPIFWYYNLHYLLIHLVSSNIQVFFVKAFSYYFLTF
jgi:hypothetical protein